MISVRMESLQLEEHCLSVCGNEEFIWTKRRLLAFVLQKCGWFEYWLHSEDPGSSEKLC